MQFLYPSLLWALGLILIPILIHLFNFQRPKKVLFTNVEFLREVKQLSRAKNRLRHLLILLSRIAFISCLVLAFAQPFLPSQNNKDKPSLAANQQVSIYLDNSFSLQNEQDNKRLLDLGATYAQSIPQLFSNSATFQLLDNSFSGNTNFFYPSNSIIDKLSEIDFVGTTRTVEEIYKKQQRSFSNQNQAGHIFWISDFQKSNFDNFATFQIDSASNYYLIPVSPTQKNTLLIDSVWLENPFIQANASQQLLVRVKNQGTEAVENKSIQLVIDKRQVSAATVSLPAQSQKTVPLNFSVTQSTGTVSAKVSIEDYPLLFDNDYYFTLQIAPKVNVLAIYQTTSDAQSYLKSVFTNADFFEFELSSTQNLNYNRIQESDVIILEGLITLDEALQTSLRAFLRKGGQVVVFPAPTSRVNDFNAALGLSLRKVNEEAGIGLALSPPSENDPFFDGVFEKISPSMSMPIATAVWTGLSSGQSILRFRNGQPFLMRQQSGAGSVFVVAAPLSTAWSGLGTHAIFVPTMYKIALSSLSQVDKLAFSLDEQTAVLSLDSLQKNEIFELIALSSLEMNSNQTGIIPSQRISGSQLLFEIPRTDLEAGVYALRNKDSKIIKTYIAFNNSRKESKLDFYTAEELQARFGNQPNVQVYNPQNATDFVQDFKTQNENSPLWRYFLIAALVMIALEIVLVRWK